ncbi:MAG TPA: methyltransferase domain-containing protein [Anaeromyxobacteraceae bacterium]|nr:methyltransferase domain-containing protein [Anaeromyxobacteraceae bacterium]
MKARDRYTFGDNDRASARLRRLARLYEPETRELLRRHGTRAPRLAIDLGCGPGWSTRLLREVLSPFRTVGLDASERFVAEARRGHGAELEFLVHDVTRAPFPTPKPNLLLCRFLLTHLRLTCLQQVLAIWASVSAPGARLLIHETERLEADHPALRRYYELVDELQAHHGQALHVGRELEGCLATSEWKVIDSHSHLLEKPAAAMADLHLANLRTWREEEYARTNLDPRELEQLEGALERIARGTEHGGTVWNAARQIAAELRQGL